MTLRSAALDLPVSLDFNALNCVQPYPGAPYFQGRVFSSGNPYSVVASNALGVNLTDYAIGGATSGAVPGALTIPASYTNTSRPTVVEVPSTLDQVKVLSLLTIQQ